MKKVLLLLAVFISISIIARKGEMNVKPKTAEPKKDGIVCCEIYQLNTFNDIRINKICVGKGKSVIELQFEKQTSACTILESNILIDDKGKQYTPTYHNGLANCPDLTIVRQGHKFYWGFETIDRTAKSLKLKEDEKMHPDMIPFKWTEFSIDHCKW